VEVIGYADATSSPVPLRGTAYAADYPAPPDATVTVYRDEFGAIRYSDRSFTDLVEAAFDRHKAREREGPKPPVHTYSGRIFDLPAPPANEVELAYQEQMRRVEEVRRQRPELSVAEALVEVERYGAGEPQTAAPTPAPADCHVEHYGADRIAQVRRRLSNLDFIAKDPAHAYQAHAEKAALLERYGSHLGGKDRSDNPGVCVAFWVPSKVASKLTIPGAVPADELHVTLAYLGRRSRFADWELDSIAGIVKQVAAEFSPMAYSVTGSGSFPASDSSDGKNVVFAKVESEDLLVFRRHLVARLADAGFVADDKHGKYVPHVTAAYIKPGSPLPELEVKGGRIEVPAREVVLAIGDSRKTFTLSGKRELYSATLDRARTVLYGLAAARYASTAAGDDFRRSHTGFITLPTPPELLQDRTWRNAKAPSADVGLARLPSQTARPAGRSLFASIHRIMARGRQVAGQLGATGGNGGQSDRFMRGLAAAVAQRKAGASPSASGGEGKPPGGPGGAGVAVPVVKPPAGGGPARAAAVAPTPAPAPDPRAGMPSQARADTTSDHTFLDLDLGGTKAPDPAGRPSQMRPDRTTDVGAPRPTPALSNSPAEILDGLPETRPAGIFSPGQSSKGQMARQNNANPQQTALRKIQSFINPPLDSIGGKESRSGLQMQPGSAGLKPVTNPAPPVSGLPRKTRSQEDRSRDGSNSIV
jgi:2'-5' RNA ligase